MADDLELALIDLIQRDPWMMAVLEAARGASLPDWCIAGGFVRAKVWDHLHGYQDRTPPGDIDLLYFDPSHSNGGSESRVEAGLRLSMPEVEWEPVNQARIHRFNEDPPYSSTADALSHWAETTNAVGVCLDQAGKLRVVAPLGLDDLFGLRVRANLKSPTAKDVYLKRLKTKGWKERWPKVTMEMP